MSILVIDDDKSDCEIGIASVGWRLAYKIDWLARALALVDHQATSRDAQSVLQDHCLVSSHHLSTPWPRLHMYFVSCSPLVSRVFSGRIKYKGKKEAKKYSIRNT